MNTEQQELQQTLRQLAEHNKEVRDRKEHFFEQVLGIKEITTK